MPELNAELSPTLKLPAVIVVTGTVLLTAGNGSKDGSEPGLSNITVTISVDADGAGGNPPIIYTLYTNATGDYTLAGVPGTALVVITVDEIHEMFDIFEKGLDAMEAWARKENARA